MYAAEESIAEYHKHTGQKTLHVSQKQKIKTRQELIPVALHMQVGVRMNYIG